jgi:hypothetical protein
VQGPVLVFGEQRAQFGEGDGALGGSVAEGAAVQGQRLGSGVQTPLLLVLPSPGREAEVRRAIGIPGIPAATAANPIIDPAAPLWLEVGKHDERVRLAALTGAATSA